VHNAVGVCTRRWVATRAQSGAVSVADAQVRRRAEREPDRRTAGDERADLADEELAAQRQIERPAQRSAVRSPSGAAPLPAASAARGAFG
jgi:hypothetical protein